MGGTREKALVGLFVLVAIGLLFGVTMALTGGVGGSSVPHSAYFKFSGGLEAGTQVRYGGLSIGKITKVHVDPQDTTRIEIDFAVAADAPIRTDSVARISSMGLLSDNFLEISPGTKAAAKAAAGSVVASKEPFGFDDISDAVQAMLPDAQTAMKTLTADLDGLHTTIASANDLLNEKNRANVAATLNTLNGTMTDLRPALNATLKSVDQLLADAQPKISDTLSNLQGLTTKLDGLLSDLNKTVATANTTITHVDGTLDENREDIRASVTSLRAVLEKAGVLVGQLNSSLNNNSDNIDETLDNVRLATENLRQFTDTLKTSPTSLIRGTGVRDRRPGGSFK
ncbi:MAG TPA: MlaD family protein [Bryobacteraceae bacterium]|jgi:phospholipid/cholesterol/gamma-HCH transport system substrate-binding protein|nr:MlaD family protein [Bryobacteraceae bacterium]